MSKQNQIIVNSFFSFAETANSKLQVLNVTENLAYFFTSLNMKTYNVDPLKSHFYIKKLGFTGVYIIFLILCSKT